MSADLAMPPLEPLRRDAATPAFSAPLPFTVAGTPLRGASAGA